MFGSISNWINTNVSNVQQQVQQQVQNVSQAIPPVNIPNFLGKKNGNGEGEQSETGNNNTSNPPFEGDDTTTPKPEPKNEVLSDQSEIRPADDSTVDEASSTSGESDPNKSNKKTGLINMPIEVDAQKALGTAKEFGNNIGNMLFSFGKNASTNVLKTATQLKDAIEKTPIIGDFTKENEKFVNEKKTQQKKEEAAVPPWVGYHQEDKLKAEIMELSTDSRNFLRCPPPGVDFPFDFNTAYPIALATLEEDQNLKDMRFKLVPGKIKEEEFWRNYFYRVTLIRQSNQLNAFSNETSQSYENSTKNFKSEESDESKHSLSTSHNEPIVANNEFVSDSYDHEAINEEEINKDLRQLNLNNNTKKDIDDTDWDKELPEDLDNISAEELEKEINQMIGRN
jgi:hypothetical protein